MQSNIKVFMPYFNTDYANLLKSTPSLNYFKAGAFSFSAEPMGSLEHLEDNFKIIEKTISLDMNYNTI